MTLTLENPYYLWLLLMVSLFILFHFVNYTKRKGKVLKFANYDLAKKISRGNIIKVNVVSLIRSGIDFRISNCFYKII